MRISLTPKLFVLFAIPFLAGLLACKGDQEQTYEEAEKSNENLLKLIEETGEQILENPDDNSDTPVAFEPYSLASRYNTEEPLKFDAFKFQSVFEVGFPMEPEYEEEKKSDHVSFSASTVYMGTIYRIDVEDYSSHNISPIDNGFVKYSHDAMVTFMEGNALHSNPLLCDKALAAYYTCYSYTMDENTYNVDYITYGNDHYLVHLEVTSRPKFEAASKVKEFISSFRFL